MRENTVKTDKKKGLEDTIKKKVKYITKLKDVNFLAPEERAQLMPVTDKFVFRTTDYYNSLIDPNDPDDPLRNIVIPTIPELDEIGKLDASDEASYTVVPGLEHKYPDTALLLVNDICAAYCRFCFRKRLFMNENDEVVRDITEGLRYIREHKEIKDVLLTGGDPLMISTSRLEKIISPLREIDHVKIIRIGSKVPAFNPYRILNDPGLTNMLANYITLKKKIYLMAHFNHPRELTKEAGACLYQFQKANVMMNNQTPLIRGVNDKPEVLGELFDQLYSMGIPPYYVFICRPTLGNSSYSIPIEESLDIFENARRGRSGLASRARLIMSDVTGKIEVLGKDKENVYMKYHHAVKQENQGKILVFKRNPQAMWFDDYKQQNL